MSFFAREGSNNKTIINSLGRKICFDIQERLRFEGRNNNFDFNSDVDSLTDDSWLLNDVWHLPKPSGPPANVAEISAIETLLRSLAPLKAAALLPKVALRGTTDLKAIRLRGKSMPLQIGLLRLKDSSTNSTVAAFTELAKTVVPKILGKQRS